MSERFSPVSIITMLLAAAFVLAFSVPWLTTKPKIGVDESVTVDIAHNILAYGVVNISTAPGEFPPRPYTIAATGYAVTYPLAGFFGLFGFGYEQARVYMLLWIAVFLASMFWVVGKTFGESAALAALFLTISFATFYDIGRTAMGELPGFVFLLWGFYLLSKSPQAHQSALQRYGLAGLFVGLAVATKPSLYIPLVPVMAIFFLSERRRVSFRNAALFACSAAIPVLVWIWSVFPYPFSFSAWMEAYRFLSNPFGRPILQNILSTLALFPKSSTLIYFSILALCAFFAYSRAKYELAGSQRVWMKLALLYALFGFFYFIRSPGWFRYLFGAELMLLILAYPALRYGAGKLGADAERSRFPFAAALFLILVQFMHLFTGSTIFSSNAPQTVGAYLLEELRQQGGSVGIFDNEQIAALIPAEQRYHQFHWTGIGLIGRNPLSLPESELPRLLVVEKNKQSQLTDPYREVFENYYAEKKVFYSSYYIYEKKPI